MEIHISGRGVDVAALLRRRVEAKVGKVGRFLPKIIEARVVLTLERYRHLAEITLQAKRATLRAEAAAADFHTAVDRALHNLQQQARRHKGRIQARKPRRARRQVAEAPASVTEAPEEAGAIVVRRLSAKPMTVDEALELLRGRRDGVLVFTNAQTRTVNVLHRRADGELELVQPGG